MTNSEPRFSRLAMLALLLVGFAMSLWVYTTAKTREITRAKSRIAASFDAQAESIPVKLADCTERLESLAELLTLHPDMEADTFRVFARRTLSRQPAFRGILWAAGTDETNSALSLRGQEAPELTADLISPAKLLAFEQPLAKARVTGKAALGGGIGIGDNEILFPLVVPIRALVQKQGGAIASTGFLIALCAPAKLVAIPESPSGEWLLVDLNAIDVTRRQLFYVNRDAVSPALLNGDADPAWRCEKTITVGDRTWHLFFRPDPSVFEQSVGRLPLYLLASCGGLTLLLAAFLYERQHRGRAVESETARRTQSLTQRIEELESEIQRHQQAETTRQISEQTLHSLMENSPGAIYVKDIDGRYIAVNRRFVELHGRSRESFIGKSDFELFPPELASRVRKSDAQVMASSEAVEIEESFQLMDGVHINLVHKFPLIDSTGAVHGVCAISSDITERKRAEAEVRESRRQLESLMGQLPGMAFRYANDSKYTPLYVSRGAAGLTGHTARDFLDRRVSLEEIIHPDDRHRVRSAIAAAVRKRRNFEMEYRLIDRSGREKWVLERGQGYYDENGALLFIEGLAIDITQRKDAESEKLLVERRLLEGQKLESIGVLAGGIAHDFNNLLTGVIGNANLASLDLPPQSPIRNNLKQIEVASQRAAELCQQMLAYAGKGRFVLQPVEIGQLVASTVPLLQASISKRAKLRFDLQPELPAVMSDPTQIRQIIMNLVINASESLGEKDGEIALTTNLVQPAADWFENAVLAPPDPGGEFVRLEVRDTGCGMSAETITKVFEPFFTTKFTGRGLGLAAVLGIIRTHQGGLIVRSVVGKGSIFALFFPAASTRPVEIAASRQTSNTPWTKAGKILVVDDEAHVLKVTSGMLASAGLDVQTANDGYEALDLFRADPESYDLVLLDMTMPRLSGEETLTLLREIRPAVKVLFMSGYNRREVVDALPGRNTLGFMQKPFTLRTLRENLQQMLG